MQLYLYLSILIGIALIIDGAILLKLKGKCGKNSYLSVTTAIEFVWVIVSIFCIYKYEFTAVTVLVPASYIIHNVFGWLYGFSLIKKNPPQSDTNQDFFVPIWYVKFGLNFGIAFSLLSAFASTANSF